MEWGVAAATDEGVDIAGDSAFAAPTEVACWMARRLVLLMFRHSAKNLDAKKYLATLPLLVTRLYMPHAIVVRLHVRKSNVVILTQETAGIVGV